MVVVAVRPCVRDVNWIMDAIERLLRRNAFESSGMFGYESGGTVFSRVSAVANSDGLMPRAPTRPAARRTAPQCAP